MVQGFYFALLQYNPIQARLRRLLYRPCNYTAHAAKQRTGLYRSFSGGSSHSTATDTRPTQAAIIPSVPRWSAHTRPDALHRYQIPAPRRTLHRPAQPPIIIRYIRGAQTMPARRGLDVSHVQRLAIWHRVNSQGVPGQSGTIHPARQSSSRDAAGGAEPLAACAAALFGLSPDS